MSTMIKIEVAYALEEQQFLFSEEVQEGSTVAEALQASELLIRYPTLDLDKVGIFGKLVKPDVVLRAGDRIEVYRPLKADPKDRRRNKVEQERKAK